MDQHRERFYRLETDAEGLVSFRVVVGESDLLIWAERDLSLRAIEELLAVHEELEGFMERHPRFRESLVPYPVPENAPLTARAMAEAAEAFDVGPMAG